MVSLFKLSAEGTTQIKAITSAKQTETETETERGGSGLLCLWDEQSRDVCQTLYLAWFGFWKTQIYLHRDLLFLDLLKYKQIKKPNNNIRQFVLLRFAC